MTKRRLMFHDVDKETYVISELYYGDKSELEQLGSQDWCEYDWSAMMVKVSHASSMLEFLTTASFISNSYSRSNGLPGSRILVAHNVEEMMDVVCDADEVWVISSNTSGIRKFEKGMDGL